jgi:hypothetical protein
MTRAKRGRPKKAGDRFKCGKLRQTYDHGNERVEALCSVFRPFQAGKADQWVRVSAIGRAWAVGLLDGYDVDSAAIRDAGLNYADRYWGEWPTASGVANYEGQDRRGGSGGLEGSDGKVPDRRGEIFNALDKAVRDAGHDSRNAVHSLVIDHYHFPEDNPAWLDRLINERLVRIGRPVAGQLPRFGDAAMLTLAIEGLLTIVQGKERRAA